MTGGPHIVPIRRPGKPTRWYIYAWRGRGAPRIHVQVGGPRPKITGWMIDAIARARAEHGHSASAGTIGGLIVAYRGSSEFRRLRPGSQTNYNHYLSLIDEKFGKARVSTFNDRRIRSDILEWRDTWGNKARAADEAIKVLRRLLYWAIERAQLERNFAANIKPLYKNNRAKIIWTESDFAAFNESASIQLREGVELAACTGLRRSDLVEVSWSAVGEHAIVRPTNKSGGETEAIIPLLPETRELLARIKARHADEMSKLPEEERKDLPHTILANEDWQPWKVGSFGQAVHRVRKAAGMKVRLHDIRGTFATRLMLAGLNDQQVAGILGWRTEDVAAIRAKYVDHNTIMLALAKRISGEV